MEEGKEGERKREEKQRGLSHTAWTWLKMEGLRSLRSLTHPASEEDSEGEEEGVGQPLEDEEEMKRLWGPLRRPVQVKIADLGNACWVVSE